MKTLMIVTAMALTVVIGVAHAETHGYAHDKLQ